MSDSNGAGRLDEYKALLADDVDKRLGGRAGSATWTLGESDVRGQSIVDRILVEADGGPPVEYYAKELRPDPSAPNRSARFRRVVEQSKGLSARVGAALSAEGIGVSEVAATDPARLRLVTLAVSGSPIGKAWERSLTPGRRTQAKRLYLSAGRAISVMEGVSLGQPESVPYLRPARLERARRALATYLSSKDAEVLESTVAELNEALEANPPDFYNCHGDLNGTNLLVDGARLNLIDFDWSPRPAGFDLAMFLLRLEFERPQFRRWSRTVSRWALAGYGDEHIEDAPAYRAVRLIKIAEIAKAARVGDVTVRRAVEATLRR